MSNRQDRKRRQQQRPQTAAETSAPRPEEQGDAATDRDPRTERVELLNDLQAKRGVDWTVAYITSSRPGLAAQMSLDAVRRVIDHLPEDRVEKLDLFLHSDGGDSIVPWRLMSLLREHAEEVNVVVPHHAFSAATLAGLGADNIVMHRAGMLGPIDPTVHDPFGPIDPETGQRPGVSVEDVASYNALVRDDVGITGQAELVQAFSHLAQEVHPLTLGHVKRGTNQARMLGEKLLRLRDKDASQADIDKLLEELTTRLYYHGHPISRREAVDLGLHVELPAPDVEAAIWALYTAYENELDMESNFDPIGAVVRDKGVPTSPQAPKTGRFDAIRRVMVESESRCDVFDIDVEITLARTAEGALSASTVTLAAGWYEL